MDKKKYEVIIIGGGPSGMTAAIYTARRALSTLVISMDVGGQMNMTNDIENYPGIDLISGAELGMKMQEQAKKFGVDMVLNKEIKEIREESDGYIIKNGDDEYGAESVILAFGKTPRQLDVPGNEKYQGRGVSYCVNCDGLFFKNKTVAIVGGGNSALDAALYMAKLSPKVYLIHRRDEFRGEEIIVNQVKEQENIELVLDSEVKEIMGSDVVEKVKVVNVKNKEEREIETEGIFVEIGFEVKNDFVKDLVKTDDHGQIIVDMEGRTSDPGIFASGDLTNISYKQIVIAAGQGASAALSAYDYIQKKKGKKTIKMDWGK